MRHINVSKRYFPSRCVPLPVLHTFSRLSVSRVKLETRRSTLFTSSFSRPSPRALFLRDFLPLRPSVFPPLPVIIPIFTPTSLLYIWAGRVSKLCLPIAAWKDKLDVIRFVDCIHYYIIMHRSHAHHQHYTRAHTRCTRWHLKLDTRRGTRETTDRCVSSVHAG